ncbi:MAG TPA: hypothetical protein VIY48_04885 [Candidatus Paceibacterota bacterium]
MQLTVDRNYVEMNQQRIARPSSCSPGQWLDYWKPLNSVQEQLDYLNGRKAKKRKEGRNEVAAKVIWFNSSTHLLTDFAPAEMLKTVEQAVQHIQSGNARVCLRSRVSGNAYNYWIRENSNGKTFLVYLIRVSGDLGYMGVISNGEFKRTEKSRVAASAPAFKAFAWVWQKFIEYRMPEGVSIEPIA